MGKVVLQKLDPFLNAQVPSRTKVCSMTTKNIGCTAVDRNGVPPLKMFMRIKTPRLPIVVGAKTVDVIREMQIGK